MASFIDQSAGFSYAPTQDYLSHLTDPSRPPSAPRDTSFSGPRLPESRSRKKSHNDPPEILPYLALLNDVGKNAAQDYSGTTNEDRVLFIKAWAQRVRTTGVQPLVREGERGRRNGGGTFKCTSCQKEYPTLQKAMAHLFSDWKISLWRCTLDGCTRKYRSLNELRRHQKESHRVLLPRELKALNRVRAIAEPSIPATKKPSKSHSTPRRDSTQPRPILPSPPLTASIPTPTSNPIPPQSLPVLSPVTSPVQWRYNLENPMTAMAPAPPQVTPFMPSMNDTGYGHFVPTVNPTSDFDGQPQMHVPYHHQSTGPIAHYHYGQHNQAGYGYGSPQYAVPSPNFEYSMNGFQQPSIPNDSEYYSQPSNEDDNSPLNGVEHSYY